MGSQSPLLKDRECQESTAPKLRGTQPQDKDNLYRQIKDGNKRILFCAPCGYGKSHIIASIIYDAAVVKQKRVLVVVPFQCLIEQLKSTLAKYRIGCGVIAGGQREDRDQLVQIAMRQTLERHRDTTWFNEDIVLIDEVHTVAFTRWGTRQVPRLLDGKQIYTLEALNDTLNALNASADMSWHEVKSAYRKESLARHPDQGGTKEDMQRLNHAWDEVKKHQDLFNGDRSEDHRIIIGFTASPFRLSKRELFGDVFESQVKAPTPNDMVESGYLTPTVCYGVSGANLKGVKVKGGDYNIGELAIKCNAPEVVRSIADNYEYLCPDRLFICFAVNVEHAVSLTREFNKRDIPCQTITGDTPTKAREDAYSRLAEGELRGLVSVGCLSVGFDVPNVSCVMLCRPTKSMALYLQQVGRGMRIAPNKKDCMVLDQAGSIKRFGFIEELKYPDLTEPQSPPEVKLKQCPQCGKYSKPTVKVCKCGYKFEQQEKGKGKNATGETPVGLLQKYFKDPKVNEYRTMLLKAYEMGYSPGYATVMFKKEHGFYPKQKKWSVGAIFSGSKSKENKLKYRRHLEDIARRKEKDERWVEWFMELEFQEV